MDNNIETGQSNDLMDAMVGFGSSKFAITFRDIALRHLMKISTMASREFRGGYWQQKTKVSKEGMTFTEKVYIPDTREEYSNAVNYFHDILIPHFDKEMESKSKELNDKLDDLRVKCIETTSVEEEVLLGCEKKDAAILSIESYEDKDKLIIESYRFAKLRITRKLFQEICKFLKRWNYGQPKPITD